MSISTSQATQATIFLTLYKQAIETVKQSAERNATNQVIESFTDRIIPIVDNKVFRKICDPKDPSITYQNSKKYRDIVKDVRVFQFSHYLFQKYLPNFINYEGNSKALIFYLRQQNNAFEKQLNQTGVDLSNKKY